MPSKNPTKPVKPQTPMTPVRRAEEIDDELTPAEKVELERRRAACREQRKNDGGKRE